MSIGVYPARASEKTRTMTHKDRPALLPVTDADRKAWRAAFSAYADRVNGRVRSDTIENAQAEGHRLATAIIAHHRLQSSPAAGSGEVPSGWRLVPEVPTILMQNRGWGSMSQDCAEDTDISAVWSAMLAAAPAPSTAVTDTGESE